MSLHPGDQHSVRAVLRLSWLTPPAALIGQPGMVMGL